MKRIYKVPLVWSMMGILEVEAESEETAIKIALDSATPLPAGSYLTDSVEVDYESGIRV
jgi:hypothetical protein